MQGGKYYVGDLCYVMHESWDEVCSLIIKDNYCQDGEFTLKDGRRFAIYSTAFGDGSYLDQEGNEYWVDSGSIGCILLDDIDEDVKGNHIDGGHIHEFEHSFYTGSQDAKIMFHTVSIDTDPNDEEEE